MRNDDLSKIIADMCKFAESNECVLSPLRAQEICAFIQRLRDVGPAEPRTWQEEQGKLVLRCACGLKIDVLNNAPCEAKLVHRGGNNPEVRVVLECPHCQVLWVQRDPDDGEVVAYRPAGPPLRYWEADVRERYLDNRPLP